MNAARILGHKLQRNQMVSGGAMNLLHLFDPQHHAQRKEDTMLP